MARADYAIESIFTKELTDAEWDWLTDFEERLRQADRRELIAAAGDAWTAIDTSIVNSEACYRVSGDKGQPLVLYGRCKVDGIPGRLIWCVATDELKPYEREFARVSRKILQEWAEEFGILWNAVGEFNEPAMRWLKWCGAEFGKPLDMGGEKFIRFYIRRTENV